MNQEFKKNRIKRGLGFALLFVVGGAVMIGVVWYLWNALLPNIFGLPQITFWQAAGLLVLSKILFGGFRMGHRGRPGPKFGNPRFREKLMHMSDEEKANFREEWKRRCGK